MATNRTPKTARLVLVLLVTSVVTANPLWAGGDEMNNSWKIKNGAIPDSLRSKMEELAGRESIFDGTSLPRPPWVEFPHLDRFSMGWRMGAGEDYISGFRSWFASLDERQQSAYELLNPEPDSWRGYYRELSG